MLTIGFDQLTAEVSAVRPVRDIGRVVEIGRGTLEVSGLSDVAAQGGDLVEIGPPGEKGRLGGEVLNLSTDTVTVLPDGGDVEGGLQIGAAVSLRGGPIRLRRMAAGSGG